MANKLVTKEPTLISLDEGNSSLADCHPCRALKQNLGGHDFKANRDEVTVATRWLKTHSTGQYQKGLQQLVSRYDKCPTCGEDYVEM